MAGPWVEARGCFGWLALASGRSFIGAQSRRTAGCCALTYCVPARYGPAPRQTQGHPKNRVPGRCQTVRCGRASERRTAACARLLGCLQAATQKPTVYLTCRTAIGPRSWLSSCKSPSSPSICGRFLRQNAAIPLRIRSAAEPPSAPRTEDRHEKAKPFFHSGHSNFPSVSARLQIMSL